MTESTHTPAKRSDHSIGVLPCLDYPDRDDDVVGSPDSLIVGPPEVVAADAGENLPLSRSPER